MIQIKAPASWRSWIEVELRLKRKWSDGSESLIFSQRDFVERLAGIIPPAWFNLTRFHGVFAPNHAWRDFVVPGPTKKRTCPAHDEPNDSDPPPTDGSIYDDAKISKRQQVLLNLEKWSGKLDELRTSIIQYALAA